MSTIADRYPDLTALHHEFMRALAHDPEPKENAAYLWFQGIEFDRSALKPSATSRGHEELCYLHFTEQRDAVPGQNFPEGKTPTEVCSALISQHAADWDGPFQINFRYDRNAEGIWSGFYSIETSARHRDILAGRAEFDSGIAEAMKAGWEPDMVKRLLNYGSVGDDAGPKIINTPKVGKSQRLDADPQLLVAWKALEAYLNAQGVRQVYYASYRLTKPTARLRDGDNAQLIYWI